MRRPGRRRPGLAEDSRTRRRLASRPDPEIITLVQSRLAAQPDRSIREATRQLNVWEYYERVLAATAPLEDPALTREAFGDAHHPGRGHHPLAGTAALPAPTHQFPYGTSVAAAAAADDNRWPPVARAVFPGHKTPDDALAALRQLLRDHNGAEVANLATRLL